MIPLVTAATVEYWPGVVALYNSFKQNAGPGFEFYAILYGEKLQAKGRALGLNVLQPPNWMDQYPTSSEWPKQTPAAYARLVLPTLFPDRERVIWLDADCIITKPLAELASMKFSEVVAAVKFDTGPYTMGFQVRNVPPDMRDLRMPFNGLLVFNVAEWNRQRITEQCREAMTKTNLVFQFADQSVLGYVLRGRFHGLEYRWQFFANRHGQEIPHNAVILHWVGTLSSTPWMKHCHHQAEWDKYAAATE
jgi:lipopolysaccharide biosynthesis glycosyltransferase